MTDVMTKKAAVIDEVKEKVEGASAAVVEIDQFLKDCR